MPAVDLMSLLGGLGVLLFSFRLLTQGLRRSIGRRFRPLLAQYVNTPAQAFLAGFVVTVLVQASSITIVTAMGLVSATLLTFEQGVFVMLGATLGTTLEFWFLSVNLQYGRGLVGVASLLYLVVRRPLARELLELVIAVGFAFLGLEMMARGVEPLASDPGFVALIKRFDGSTFSSQLFAAGTGFVLTTVMQSSSAVVFLVLRFATDGLLTVPAGIALVLGANVGTTITALIAGLELDWRGRRLAVAHLFVKGAGVALALLAFPVFAGLVASTVRVTGWRGPAAHLIAAHSLFNALNAAVFALGAGLLVRVVRAATPADPASAVALPVVVRRMLASSPERALQEAERQLDRLRQLSKALVDDGMGLLAHPGITEAATSPIILGRAFDEVREALQDLLIQLTRSPLAVARGDHFSRLFAQVDACHALYEEGLGLMSHLQRGLLVEGHQLPPALHAPIETLARAFDGCWIQVVFPGSTPDAPSPRPAWEALSRAFVDHVRAQPGAHLEPLAWLQETLARLGRLVERLEGLLATGGAPMNKMCERSSSSG